MKTPRYHKPKKMGEALALLSSEGRSAFPLAGGTDVVVKMRAGHVRPTALVDLGLLGLGGIRPAQDAVVVGATCTMAELQRHPTVRQELPTLAHAAAQLGANQIQHMATLGGNLCNASPAADGVCALVALDARVMLRSPNGVRSVPVLEFLTGPGQTLREPNELVQAISVPRRTRDAGLREVQTFRKIGGRDALVCSLVAVAGVTRLEGDRVASCRLGLAAVGPTTLRARRAEALVTGERLTEELCRTAAAAAAAEATPIDDHRASAAYRRRLVAALVREHLLECLTHG